MYSSQSLYDISIHAPAWGATLLFPIPPRRRRNFNPRPRMGSDRIRFDAIYRSCNFNPRPRMGSDARKRIANAAEQYFNPRPRMGSDCNWLNSRLAPSYFNPRPRMGSDAALSRLSQSMLISIHAPAWGATAGSIKRFG